MKEKIETNDNNAPINSDLQPRRGGVGHLGIFWVGMCRPGLQDWHPVLKKIPPKMDTLF